MRTACKSMASRRIISSFVRLWALTTPGIREQQRGKIRDCRPYPLERGLERPIAAGRVRVEPTARSDGEGRRLLHRLHREIAGRVDDDTPLAADPDDNRWPVFVVVPPTGFAFLAAPTHAAPQRLLPALLGLPLVAGSLGEVIGFDRPVQLAANLIGEGGIAEPPTPAIAGADMDPQLSGNAP